MPGFQLWANLPSADKMMNPRYQDIPSGSIPEAIEDDGSRTIKIELDQNAFAYVFKGLGIFKGASNPIPAPTEYMTEVGVSDTVTAHPVENRNLVLFDRGDEIRVEAGEKGMRFLLISGQPLKEPVAWHGPIVMNTREELIQAFTEYENGTLLKHQNKGGV